MIVLHPPDEHRYETTGLQRAAFQSRSECVLSTVRCSSSAAMNEVGMVTRNKVTRAAGGGFRSKSKKSQDHVRVFRVRRNFDARSLSQITPPSSFGKTPFSGDRWPSLSRFFLVRCIASSCIHQRSSITTEPVWPMLSAISRRAPRSSLRFCSAPQLTFARTVSSSACAYLPLPTTVRMDANISCNDPSKTAITSHNQYKTSGLERDELSPSPIVQFNQWFKHAAENGVPEPEAMTISTVAVDKATGVARPSSRVVLLKQVDPEGFLFFSNYSSRKGRELEGNPYASLAFYWKELSRSVRVCGRVEKLSHSESKQYYDSRPLGSRIGAWASPQSTTISSRQELEQKVKDVEAKFNVPNAAGLEEGKKFQGDEKQVDVPLPDFWGGYRIVPDEVEFWCGRPNRLHDRFRYTRSIDSKVAANEDKWTIDRLAP